MDRDITFIWGSLIFVFILAMGGGFMAERFESENLKACVAAGKSYVDRECK